MFSDKLPGRVMVCAVVLMFSVRVLLLGGECSSIYDVVDWCELM